MLGLAALIGCGLVVGWRWRGSGGDALHLGTRLEDWRRNPRGELGTRTATLDRAGLGKLRRNWIYRL